MKKPLGKRVKERGSDVQNPIFYWSGRQDLNLRHLDPQSSALPSCATARKVKAHIIIALDYNHVNAQRCKLCDQRLAFPVSFRYVQSPMFLSTMDSPAFHHVTKLIDRNFHPVDEVAQGGEFGHAFEVHKFV